ncbi:right-handed parallel beta-helix repeat-containing protein [Parafrankia discariae]|uniref:right-handed parallel beta-helix repeat-containing protein n=1 Tax=Parafrankia discariae TaxID=365528 RepID=UPI0007C710D7|nr:right-handed parallel beta-helix repeat-containing protein [Parafrankia discariae]
MHQSIIEDEARPDGPARNSRGAGRRVGRRDRRRRDRAVRTARRKILVSALCLLVVVGGTTGAILHSALGGDDAGGKPIQLADTEPRYQNGVNFLPNPGFENTVAGWSVGPSESSRLSPTVPGRSGSGAAVVTARARVPAITLTDTPDAVPWTGARLTYLGAVWVRTTAPGTRVQLRLTELDGARTAARTLTNVTLNDATWRKIEVSLRATATGHRLDFAVVADRLPSGQFLYADDASLLIGKPSSPAPTGPAATTGGQPSTSPPVSASPRPGTSATPSAPTSGQPRPSTAPPAPGGSGITPIPAGMPNASTTGVRAGTSLTLLSGDQRITRAGTVIENRDVRGCIRVEADNVVIRNSRISCRSSGSAVIKNLGRNLLVEDVTIDGQGASNSGMSTADFTARRVNISNTIDGFFVNDNILIENSYVHHLAQTPSSHNDAVQTTGGSNIVLRHNTLIPINETTGESSNAGYMFGQNIGPISRVVFDGNFINGGGFTLNGAGDVTFVNNRFGRNCLYGIKAFKGSQVKFDQSNIWADTGRPVNDDPKC